MSGECYSASFKQKRDAYFFPLKDHKEGIFCTKILSVVFLKKKTHFWEKKKTILLKCLGPRDPGFQNPSDITVKSA